LIISFQLSHMKVGEKKSSSNQIREVRGPGDTEGKKKVNPVIFC